MSNLQGSVKPRPMPLPSGMDARPYAPVSESGQRTRPRQALFLHPDDVPWWSRPSWANNEAAWEAACREVAAIVGVDLDCAVKSWRPNPPPGIAVPR